MRPIGKNTGKHSGSKRHRLPPGVHLLYEDDHILIVEKPAGLLSVATDKRTTGTLYSKLTEYVRKGSSVSRNRIFIVHRLDRDASGVMVFAKTIDAKVALQDSWEGVKKKYLVIVHGRLPIKNGVITSYLIENKAQVVRSTRDEKNGKLSRTAYAVLQETRDLSLLEIDLLTGRKNQIRVHLSEHGNPIVGDQKYGRKNDPHKHMALHAHSIQFAHPVTGEPIAATAGIPSYFHRLMKMPTGGKDV